jgi:hypothetical protein
MAPATRGSGSRYLNGRSGNRESRIDSRDRDETQNGRRRASLEHGSHCVAKLRFVVEVVRIGPGRTTSEPNPFVGHRALRSKTQISSNAMYARSFHAIEGHFLAELGTAKIATFRQKTANGAENQVRCLIAGLPSKVAIARAPGSVVAHDYTRNRSGTERAISRRAMNSEIF